MCFVDKTTFKTARDFILLKGQDGQPFVGWVHQGFLRLPKGYGRKFCPYPMNRPLSPPPCHKKTLMGML